MISMEFDIIDNFDYDYEYRYAPEKYNCIEIDDDLYMNDWYVAALNMPTFFHNAKRPSFSFSRCGVTLIPPSSLPVFLQIIINDKHYGINKELTTLYSMIKKAKQENKYMIHFGI